MNIEMSTRKKIIWDENVYTKHPKKLGAVTTQNECDITRNTSIKNDGEPSIDTIKEKVSGIYKIINKINGKYYIGSSSNVLRSDGRWHRHKWMLRNNRHNNIHLQRAWNRDGEHNFDFVIIELVPEKELLSCEQKHLDCDLSCRENCYNFSFVAGKIEMTKEIRSKIGVASHARLQDKTKHPMYGKHHNSETRYKIHKKLSGYQHSSDFGERIGNALRNRIRPDISLRLTGENNPMFNKTHSAKIRKKISNTLNDGRMSGSKNGMYDKRVHNFYNYNTSETFTGTRYEFYQQYNLRKSSVCQLIQRKLKSTQGWKIEN